MKLFTLFTLATASLAPQKVNEIGTIRNGDESLIEFSGEENADQLLEMIVEISGSETDEIEAAIMAMMGVDRIETDEQVRKFRHLKIIVLWLQKSKQFGKYCYYGCYCLPEGSHNIAAGGYGRPKDEIDRACFDFKTCYHCLIEQHDDNLPSRDGKCRGEDIGYRYQLTENLISGQKGIRCLNREGSCRRNICECDKRLSEQFARFEDQWNQSFHSNRGGFDRDEECHVNPGPPIEHCCGDRRTFPFNQIKHQNQCCEGPFAKEAGECLMNP